MLSPGDTKYLFISPLMFNSFFFLFLKWRQNGGTLWTFDLICKSVGWVWGASGIVLIIMNQHQKKKKACSMLCWSRLTYYSNQIIAAFPFHKILTMLGNSDFSDKVEKQICDRLSWWPISGGSIIAQDKWIHDRTLDRTPKHWKIKPVRILHHISIMSYTQ